MTLLIANIKWRRGERLFALPGDIAIAKSYLNSAAPPHNQVRSLIGSVWQQWIHHLRSLQEGLDSIDASNA